MSIRKPKARENPTRARARELVWRRSMLWNGERVQVGHKIPDDLAGGRLARLMESGHIGFHAQPPAGTARREFLKGKDTTLPPTPAPDSGTDGEGGAPDSGTEQPPPGAPISIKTNDGRMLQAFAEGVGHVGHPPEEQDEQDEQADSSEAEAEAETQVDPEDNSDPGDAAESAGETP